jgi:hypothetical protein
MRNARRASGRYPEAFLFARMANMKTDPFKAKNCVYSKGKCGAFEDEGKFHLFCIDIPKLEMAKRLVDQFADEAPEPVKGKR